MGNEFESHQKKQHCNNFREFFIRIRYPVIKSRVFLHFSPIPHSPIPHKSPLPTISLLPKQIFIVIFFNVIFTLFGFFSCGSPTWRSRKKREMVMDQEQAYEINFIFRLACDFITCVGYCAAEIFCGNSFCGLAFLLFVLSCFIVSFLFNKNDKKNLHSTQFVSFSFWFFFLFFIWFGLFCLFLKWFLFLLFHGKKFFPLDMTEISAVKAIFCLRSRTEIKNATCVNFKLSELYREDRLNQWGIFRRSQIRVIWNDAWFLCTVSRFTERLVIIYPLGGGGRRFLVASQ